MNTKRKIILTCIFSLLLIVGNSESAATEKANTLTSNEERKEVTQKDTAEPRPALTVFFTHYNADDVKQTDAQPCIAASRRNVCKMLDDEIRPIALAKDARKTLDLSFGDLVEVTGGKCNGIYRVEDEMAKRFRSGCIKKHGVCKKGDFAQRRKEKPCDGVYTVQKVESIRNAEKSEK